MQIVVLRFRHVTWSQSTVIAHPIILEVRRGVLQAFFCRDAIATAESA